MSAAYSDAVTQPNAGPDDPSAPHPPEPVRVPAVLIALGGTAAWLVALVVTLLVPSLHTGDRSWWPWTCAAGVALGLLAAAAIHRGRGNFSSA